MQQYTHENVRSIPHLPIYCDRYEDYRQFSPRHWHDHIEIIYVVSGSLQVDCGENEYTLQENEFFVINSNKIILIYFVYKLFVQRDECGKRIQADSAP